MYVTMSPFSMPVCTYNAVRCCAIPLVCGWLLHNVHFHAAGYCVITYLLSVGDRHFDNLLLTPNGKLLHIDFSYILGRDPKPFPPPMKLSKEMVCSLPLMAVLSVLLSASALLVGMLLLLLLFLYFLFVVFSCYLLFCLMCDFGSLIVCAWQVVLGSCFLLCAS